MKTLIVGAGALGGLIAARMLAAGRPVALATRDEATATLLRERGLRVGELRVTVEDVGSLASFAGRDFELSVLATKAHDALEVASSLTGRVLPIQNGGVAEILASRLGADRVVGGLSNLGATMHEPGVYEQKNDGHLLVDAKGTDVAEWLASGDVPVRVTSSFRGAVWSKLLLNCAVTTLGAIAGEPMRAYITRPEGRAAFAQAYAEALEVARATEVEPVRMLVDPIPPANAYDEWLDAVLASYGDLKPSMLQDFERGRRTEVDFINGYVTDLGEQHGVPTPINTRIVNLVHAIERGERRPAPANLHELMA